MRQLGVVLLSLILLICSVPIASKAATTVPIVSWNLQPTDYMEQMGIFSDPVNRRGIYSYSQATVNPGWVKWYSPYFYKAAAEKHYYFCGYSTTNPTNQDVCVALQNKFHSGNNYCDVRILEDHQSYFIYDYCNSIYDISDQAYFSFEIENSSGPSVTLHGSLETY